MSLDPRGGKAYLWPTWIAGLIAGEKSCEWAAWVKSHFYYSKRPADNEGSLLQWSVEHAEMVRSRARDHELLGRSVWIEDQNKFTYRGKVANVGAKPDLVVQCETEFVIEDCKTGRERDADVVQVAIYMLLLPLAKTYDFGGLPVVGAVVYKDRTRPVTEQQLAGLKPFIVARVNRVAAADPPARTPSADECRFCDILDCPDRIVPLPAPEIEPEPAEGALF